MSEQREEPLPTRIDRYEPLKKLATGGMAEIFLAKQSGLEGFEKVVVLKRILTHLATDEEFVSMFLDEARIAAKLSHPNIAQIYDLGKADNTYYIAMEYVSGRNVQHLINKQQSQGGHLPVEHVCRIMAGVCDGLFYAHSRKDYDGKPLNIVHRDISPQNILVSFAGGVKVVDFGIAKASTQLAQTRAGVLKGKYAYMSPEQVRGAKVDHRSDLFAVGLVMYEMLTGMRAFERESSLKTLKAIVQEKPLNPREANPEIPMEVVKLLSKALEKNPDRRYKTAQEMQLALEDFLEQSPKKSNNVRLSRFLYELFDDELNSAEGTLIVKGVGQVIIPTSAGARAKPAVEEEIDSKTLTAALVADTAPRPVTAAPTPKTVAASSGRVRDELARPSSPPSALAKAKPSEPDPESDPPTLQMNAADDDDDGKTMPGYDLEQLERDRVAIMAKKGIAPMAVADPGALSTPSLSQPARRPVDEADARARALLEKVESMAVQTASLPQPGQRPTAPLSVESAMATVGGNARPEGRESARKPEGPKAAAPVEFEPPSVADLRWQGATKESARPNLSADDLIVGSRGPVGAAGRAAMAAPPVRYAPVEDDDGGDAAPEVVAENVLGAASTLPDELSQPTVQAAAVRPPAFFAAIGASAGMAAVAVVLFVVGAVALPAAAPPLEFGVVVVNSTPPGAAVALPGEEPVSGQLAVPLDGVERTITVSLEGYAPTEAKLLFAPGTNVLQLQVVLDPKG